MRYLLILSWLSTAVAAHAQTTTVNAVIGDESFILTFNTSPDQYTDEQLRLQTHLAFVEQLLTAGKVDHLTAQQGYNRHHVLELLHKYWTQGLFPVNEAYSDRRPCFIDRHGNICAVGYLIEKTSGRKLAEQINAKHQYDYIADMHEENIAMWANEMGLTLEECAMIQPTYGPVSPYPTSQVYEQPLKTGYGIASGLLGGMNIGFTIANASNIGEPGSNRIAWIGLVSGAVQAIYGAVKVSDDYYEGGFNTEVTRISFRANNNLSYINIASGTATFITSAINLAMRKKSRSSKGCVQVYSYPGLNHKMNMGFSFARNI